MANNRKLTTSPMTILDLTDSRKLDVYISSSLPTTQIYDVNNKTYSPNWASTNLTLTATVYLDSTDITDNTNTTIAWSKKIGTGAEVIISSATSSTLTISTNELSGTNAIITYICRATYQGITAIKEIVFTRVDTGLNGIDGLNGTSFNLLGSFDTLEALKTSHPTGNAGDAYIIQGDLYVWSIDDSDWNNVGHIQGPAGEDGEDAKNIILTSDSQVFKIDQSKAITPSTITVTAQVFNTSVTDWTYSTNGGQTFLSTTPNGVSRSGNVVTITGSTLTSDSVTIKASDGTYSDSLTVYKAFDGIDGVPGASGDPAPIAFLTNENITFAANAKGQVTGAAFTTNVVAYSGTSKVTPVIGTITGLPTGMTYNDSTTVGNELILSFAIANNATLGSDGNSSGSITIPVTSPVVTNLRLNWSKVNSGAEGNGISSITVSYGASTSASTQPTGWQSTIPTVDEDSYLWTRTIIDYTNPSIDDTVTYTYAKQGAKGDPGTPGTAVTVSSVQYQSGDSATAPPTGTWSNSVVAVPDGQYL